MNKQLLVDVRPFDISRTKIDESIKDNNGKLIVKGVLQRAEATNQNGRVYPREVLLKEVGKYLEHQVTERRALGELDHPDSSVVNLKFWTRVSTSSLSLVPFLSCSVINALMLSISL